MAKRSGFGVSRASRKAARLRKHRAEARGLPVQTEAARRATEAPTASERPWQKASKAKRAGVPLAAKILLFLALLLAAVWWAARFRQGHLD
ncbi:MAG TPA: hypothetical protein VFU02_07250 [Polyangiaceae bacterium]|nr:hypothetical protein [Polyangiaceae bacterium]